MVLALWCRTAAPAPCVQGKIDFGVINQSQSAFNHILNDVSLVIYQVRYGAAPRAATWAVTAAGTCSTRPEEVAPASCLSAYKTADM